LQPQYRYSIINIERFRISSKIGKRKVEEGIQKNEKKCEKGKGRDKEKWLRECEALARSLLGVFVPENLQFNFGKERGFADFPATILNSVYK
jgi:hypothetical protein